MPFSHGSNSEDRQVGRIEQELGNEEFCVGCVKFGISVRHVSRDVNGAIKYVSLDRWFSTSASVRSTQRA